MMPKRRTILRLAVFLLLGAAVNVAVAWCIALPPKSRTSLLWPGGASGQWFSCGDDSLFVRSGELLISRHVPVPEQHAFGVTEVDFRKHLTVAQFAALIPSWSAFSADPPAHRYLDVVRPEDYCLDISETSTGWPWLTLRMESAIRTTTLMSRIDYSDGLRLAEPSRTGGSIVLPIMPIWPGFAVNTIFYAAICWLLAAAPFALRRLRGGRRIKRGLCPACAYPVGTSAVCTECGRTVMPHVPTLVRTKRVEP